MNLSFFTQRIKEVYALRFEPEGVRTVGETFWRSTLALASLVVLGVLVYSVWTLTGILQDLSQSPGGTAPPRAYLDRAQLKTILSAFEERQRAFTGGGEQSTVVDPR